MKLRCNAALEEEEEGDGCRLLRCAAAAQQEEEGDGNCCRLLCGAAVQLHNTKKKVTAVTVAFFVELRYSCTT